MPDSLRIHPDDPLWPKALELHRRAIVIDTHSDLPLRVLDEAADIGTRRAGGHQDIPRMLAGGLDAQFFAIFIAGKYAAKGGLCRALEMLDAFLTALEANTDKIHLACSPDDVRHLKADGKIAAVLALEGGHALEGSIGALRMFYRLGFRYVTLTHVNTNALADASTDHPRWHGLSELGREVVREMNRLGMMVDVSHISDEAFWDVLETSAAPVLATHSCARALADIPRNMSDEMIRALAEKRGLVQINFASAFLHPEWARRGTFVLNEIRDKYDNDISHWERLWAELNRIEPLPEVGIDDLIAHVAHVANLVGIDHIGLGSDYDGVDRVPAGLDDVSRLPNITFALLKQGLAEADIEKILGGNVLRYWQEVEDAAARAVSRN